jgi:hypothetical protein
MDFRGDERGVTAQVGAVILLGFLVVSLSLYQATVVPQQNEQVEFRHSQAVQQDMVDLRNAIVRSAAKGPSQPTTVRLGTEYPPRTLFVNPPPPVGRLSSGEPLSARSRGTGNVTLANVSVVGSEETADFLAGSRNVSTTAVVYRPDYNEYGSAPTTVYENSVLYNQFAGGNVTLANQTLVDGRTITVVTLAGDTSLARTRAAAVDPRALSAATRTVTVQDNTTGNLTVTVPTSLPRDRWATLTSREPFVVDVRDAGPGRVQLVLSNRTTYDLRMARIGIGTGARAPDAAYLTATQTPESVPAGESTRVVLEVRDRFNNPVSGRELSAAGSAGSGLSLVGTNLSSEEGRVAYEIDPSTVGTYEVNVSIGDQSQSRFDPAAGAFDPSLPENVQVRVNATAGGGGGGGGVSRATTLLDSNFEDSLDGWSANRSGQATSEDDTNGSGYWAVRTEGPDPLAFSSPTLDGAGYGYFDVEYWVKEGLGNSGPEASDDEDLYVEYLDRNGNWQQVDRIDATAQDGAEYRRRVVIDDERAAHDGLQIRFRRPPSTASDEWFVDDVRVIGVGSPAGGTATADRSGVVYLDPNANKKSAITFVDGDGGTPTTITRQNSGSSVQYLGPYAANLDGDGADEVAYVNSKDELYALDATGSKADTQLDTGVDQARVGVGDYDADGVDEVYYVKGGAIYEATASAGPTQVADPSGVTPGAVAGVADVDGDGAAELVFTTTGPALKYLDDGGGVKDSGFGQNLQNRNAVGNPADFTGDGRARIPIVGGSGNVKLIDATTGNEETLTISPGSASSPLASTDVDGDGAYEVVYVTGSDDLHYVEVDTATAAPVTDDGGTGITAESGPGVA